MRVNLTPVVFDDLTDHIEVVRDAIAEVTVADVEMAG